MSNLQEDFETRVAINDLNNADRVKQQIIANISTEYNVTTSHFLASIKDLLGDVMFNINTFEVELHDQAMYEMTDILNISNEELALTIKNALQKLPKSEFGMEETKSNKFFKMFEEFNTLNELD